MIKVGDWVKREHADGIARVISIEEDMAVLYTGGVQSCEYLEELTKLPIKFKGFEVDKHGQVYHLRFCKSIGKTYQFVAVDDDDVFVAIFGKWYGPKTLSSAEGHKTFTTITQARDWLELQYATMIAKARGLVC